MSEIVHDRLYRLESDSAFFEVGGTGGNLITHWGPLGQSEECHVQSMGNPGLVHHMVKSKCSKHVDQGFRHVSSKKIDDSLLEEYQQLAKRLREEANTRRETKRAQDRTENDGLGAVGMFTRYQHKDGRTWAINHASPSLVIADYVKAVAEKLDDGFFQVPDRADESVRARNLELEQQADASIESLLVYSDWLQKQGDPMGEWISLTLAKEAADSSEAREDLHAKREEFRKRYPAYVNPALGSHLNPIQKGGLFQRLHISASNRAKEGAIYQSALHMLAHPSTVCLRELAVGPYKDNDFTGVMHCIVRHAARTLRKLSIVHFREGDRMRGVKLGNVEPLWAAQPQLTEVRLKATRVELGEIDAPNLELLALDTKLSKSILESIRNAKWPKLTRLETRKNPGFDLPGVEIARLPKRR